MRGKGRFIAVENLEIRRLLATITVTSTADTVTPNDGAVTLREAITAINTGNDLSDPNITAQNPAATDAFGTNDTINFNIPGDSDHTISVNSALPAVGVPMTIDGYTQPGAAVATDSTAATLQIEIVDAGAGAVEGLEIEATNVTVRGVAVNGFVNGIELSNNSGADVIVGNYLGTDLTGATAKPNANAGVNIDAGTMSRIGGTTPADRNIISGNINIGVEIKDDSTTVEGNYIGTNAAGTAALPNGQDGLYISTAANSTISDNVISGNTDAGIIFNSGVDQSGLSLQGNLIGVDVTGTAALANGTNGIEFDGSGGGQNSTVFTKPITIGGTTGDARNVISANGANGIDIEDAPAGGFIIEGNYIGTDAAGTGAMPNMGSGILMTSRGNTIGGTTAGARNIISGNGSDGIELNSGADNTVIQGNYVGTDVTGTKALANKFNGVDITHPGNTQVGGTSAGARNVISGNTGSGIRDFGGGKTGNVFQGNYIGVDATGQAKLGNGGAGIDLEETSVITIGGLVPGAANVICDNKYDGIGYSDSSNTTVQGNLIGVLADGVTAAGNHDNGILIGENSNDNVIGGSIAAAGNIIANNDDAGVELGTYAQNIPTQNTIRRNSIYNNGGIGIDMADIIEGNGIGVTQNDPGDSDDGANDQQNFPVIVSAEYTAGGVTVSGTLNSLSYTNFTLDFYANDTVDPNGNGEGKQYVGSIGVTTDAGGNTTFSGTFSVAIGSNKFISATATNESTAPYGDTSEFSETIEATDNTTPPTPPTISIGDVSMNEGNSGTTAFTFTITRSGDLSGASSVQYATADSTAKVSDSDYQPQSNTIAFDPTQASKTITILVNGDTKVESNETFFVNLTNVSGATIADAQATGTIINDDKTPPPPPPPSTGSASVVTDPCDSTKKALEIDGTDNKDTITVTKSGSSQGKAVIKINGVNKGTFSFSGGIIVNGKGGADNISIDSGITRSAYIYGGASNDTVAGGGGNDIIFGQGNDDSINGNGGRDILVGGDGTDKLNGGSGDDLLIAGDFKSAPSMSQLCSIQKEWDRTDKNYAARVKDLTNGGGFNSIKLNSSTLFSSTTLKDSMTGGSDNDLFFAAMTGDKITDKASSETAVNIG